MLLSVRFHRLTHSALLGFTMSIGACLRAEPVTGMEVSSLSEDALAEIGHRLYQDGERPDGAPIEGVNSQGVVLQGAQAACATCHRPSGYGAFEGNVMVPPITQAVLSAPGPHFIMPGATPTGADSTMPWYRAMTRSPYDEASFARAIRQGVDPDGDPLIPPMPRYDLDDREYAALFAYLRQLSATPAPGIEANRLHLATVITPDAPEGAPKAVLGVLRAWEARQRGEMPWDLVVWRLSGPPAEWKAQLEEHDREQPVFALLSGVGGAAWEPIHQFCEQMEIACVLPSVDAVPEEALSKQNVYSIYFSPGVVLEAELLDRHLRDVASEQGGQQRIVQVYGDASGQRAAEVLRTSAGDVVRGVSDRRFRRIASAAALDGVTSADTLILWLRTSELADLIGRIPEGPPTGQVYLSAWLAPPDEVSLPPTWKARVTYVSLFDDWGSESAYSRTWLQGWLQRAGLPAEGSMRASSGRLWRLLLLYAGLCADAKAAVRLAEVSGT